MLADENLNCARPNDVYEKDASKITIEYPNKEEYTTKAINFREPKNRKFGRI